MNVITFWPKQLDVRGEDHTFLTVHVQGFCRDFYDFRWCINPGGGGLYLGQQLFAVRTMSHGYEHLVAADQLSFSVSGTPKTEFKLEILDVGSMLDTMKAVALMAGAILAQAAVELTDESVDIEMVAPQRRLPEPKKELTG